MTYTKPNLFELGNASTLVLGIDGDYLEQGLGRAIQGEVPCESPNEAFFKLADGSCEV